jgi:hypothetical protein
LAPPGDASVHQLSVSSQAVGRPDTEAFHDTWPVAFDQRVGVLDQRQEAGGTAPRTQVDFDGPASPAERSYGRPAAGTNRTATSRPADLEDICAVIREHHRGETAGRPPYLNHFDALQRPSHS